MAASVEAEYLGAEPLSDFVREAGVDVDVEFWVDHQTGREVHRCEPIAEPADRAGTFDLIGRVDVPVNFGFAIAMVMIPMLMRGKAPRVQAAVLLAGYLTYMAYVVQR